MKTSQGLQKDVRTTGELNSNLVRLCLRVQKENPNRWHFFERWTRVIEF